MLDFLVDKIFIVFDNQVFQQYVDIPMLRIMLLLSVELYLYPRVTEFIHKLPILAAYFNPKFGYIDELLTKTLRISIFQ
jgi:hypothetical protein